MVSTAIIRSGQRMAATGVVKPLSLNQQQQVRNIFGLSKVFGKNKNSNSSASTSQEPEILLSQDDLFHPMSTSPIPRVRQKAENIKRLSRCPVTNEPVNYDCPLSGWPTHASKEAWESDTEKGRYIPRLREANEDLHDLLSGRPFREFELPGIQPYDESISFASWDTFLYTRRFSSVNSDRSRRHLSKLLTFPLTIGSVLHEFGPYTLRNRRITREGLRSMMALRQSLHPPLGYKPTLAKPIRPVRIFILGARAESMIGAEVWQQLSYLFPRVPLHIYFIGPEAVFPPQKSVRTPIRDTSAASSPYGVRTYAASQSEDLFLTTLQAPFQEVSELLGPFDPYHDVFFAFTPGFGYPSSPNDPTPQGHTNWNEPLKTIMASKCSLICTGYSPEDLERDVLELDKIEDVAGEYDWVITPGDNVFKSDRYEVLDSDLRVAGEANWGIFGIRGKYYEVSTEREARVTMY